MSIDKPDIKICIIAEKDATIIIDSTTLIAPKDLLIINGAGHALAFVTDPQRYKQKVLDFFAAYDPPPAVKKKRFFGRRSADT